MIVLILFVLLLCLGVPIGFTIGIATFAGLISLDGSLIGNPFLVILPSKMFAALNSFPFLAMPFFILAGEIMNKTGITDQILKFSNTLVGHYRGGLAHTNTLASLLFAGVSGSATADAAAFGRTLVPAMVRQGYKRDYACAVTAASSIVGPTIPPSGLMVLYGSVMGVSIAGLFASGIIPGLLITAGIMVMIMVFGAAKGLPKSGRKAHIKEVWQAFKESVFALLMPIIILGGILGGIVTPTEAGAIAIAYALLVGLFITKTIKLSDLPQLLFNAAKINGIVFLIVATAAALGWWLGFERIPQHLATFLTSLSSNPNMVLLIIIALLLVFGMIMDIAAILIIMGPVLMPVMGNLGIHPLHGGIVIILALNISLMTPPVGACLFVLSSVTGEKMGRIIKELFPFLVLEISMLVAIALVPALILFIPKLLGFA